MEEYENQNPQENSSEPKQEYQPAGSGGYNYSQPMPQQPTDGFGIASVILGAVGIFLSCCCTYFALPAGIVGLVFGILSARQNRKNLAVAGIVLSALAIIFAAICICVLLIVYGLDFSGIYYGIEDFFDIV